MRYLGPGQQLREIREGRGLTLKEVEAHSRQIARLRQNQQYLFTAGRLSQIENSNSLPSLYKLATLSEIYQTPYRVLLRLFGIEMPEEVLSLELHNEAERGGQNGDAESPEVTVDPRYC